MGAEMPQGTLCPAKGDGFLPRDARHKRAYPPGKPRVD